eukprot:jgi/Orpsp1_1/1176197/evm.model.c7180000056734.2
MSSLLSSSNNLLGGLYKNNILNRVNVKKLYHIFNLNPSSLNNYNAINNALQIKMKNWPYANNFIQSSSLTSTSDTGKTGKNQNKSTKSNNTFSTTKKSQNHNTKNGNDVFNFKQQQQFNQIKQQVQQHHIQQQQAQQRYENTSKAKRVVNNSINMSTISNTKSPKNLNIGRTTISASENLNKTYNSNFMYNQDVDGKTMFQQQIYNNTSFNNPRE